MASEHADLVGTPFLWAGRTLAGLDCWGLVLEVYRRLGVELQDVADYRAQDVAATGSRLVETNAPTWRQVEEPYEPYDLLLFADGSCGAVTHCALLIGDGRILHTTERTGVVLTPLGGFGRRLVGVYRHAEVACLA